MAFKRCTHIVDGAACELFLQVQEMTVRHARMLMCLMILWILLPFLASFRKYKKTYQKDLEEINNMIFNLELDISIFQLDFNNVEETLRKGFWSC